jgi:hypothetical protein
MKGRFDLETYKGRTVAEGDRVDVYRNLNTGNYSIRCSKTKLVLAHASTVQLKECTCYVQQSGREKTIREKRKRVHAWVSGLFLSAEKPMSATLTREIFYNPYTTDTFIDSEKSVVTQLDFAHFEKDRVYSCPSNLLV